MSGLHGTHDLGHTVAGWAGTAIAVIGFCVAGAAMTRGSTPGLVVGAAVITVAAAATWVLHLCGWGKPSGPRSVREQNWRVRDQAAAQGHPDCLGCRIAGRTGARRAAAASGSRPLPSARTPRESAPTRLRSAVPAEASAVRSEGWGGGGDER
ncbi:HGxxPAAW family protein [Streptomyces sp. NPDC060027]|uniref:HGxxPAAW family protein n=1 Tax=Streptomyces sp. NPDC060027 TaxID=3347040 RepID=UPI0036BDE8F7